MSEGAFEFSALLAIRDKADAEVARAKKALEKAQIQVDQAELKLRVLDETLDLLRGGGVENSPSQKQQVFKVIADNPEKWLSVSEILSELLDAGIVIPAKNASASVYVAADRLEKERKIESREMPTGKVFRLRHNHSVTINAGGVVIR